MLELGTIVRVTEDTIEDHELIEAGEIGKVEDVFKDSYLIGFYLDDTCEGKAFAWVELEANQIEKV